MTATGELGLEGAKEEERVLKEEEDQAGWSLAGPVQWFCGQ